MNSFIGEMYQTINDTNSNAPLNHNLHILHRILTHFCNLLIALYGNEKHENYFRHIRPCYKFFVTLTAFTTLISVSL